MVSADINLWFKIKEKQWLFFFVTGDVKVAAPITVDYYIKKILQWIGFDIEEQSNRIYDDSVDCFSDIRMFTEKDISDLSTDFDRSTHANGKIHFGMRRTKQMKVPLHWVQDFYRISGDITIFEINEVMFIKQLDTSMYRVDIIKNVTDKSNTKAKENSPNPLESEKI